MRRSPEGDAFVDRLRLQFQARYRDLVVESDYERLSLRLHGPGLPDTTLPLAPLYHDCQRSPSRAPRLISDFVAAAEARLVRRSPLALSLSRVLWCVRTTEYLEAHSGAGELLTRPVAGSLVAFAAESLPNAVMRGLPREEWTAAGLDDEDVRRAAQGNTESRFAAIAERIAATERIPRDGWRLAGDLLFQASLLTVPAVIGALTERVGGPVALAVPERNAVLAIPLSTDEELTRFRQRVLRTFRETLHPLSREVFVAEGEDLRLLEPPRRPRISLLDRLRV